jgi:hypothetical protein
MAEKLSPIFEHLFVLFLLNEYHFLANSEVALNILLVTFVVNVIKLNEFEWLLTLDALVSEASVLLFIVKPASDAATLAAPFIWVVLIPHWYEPDKFPEELLKFVVLEGRVGMSDQLCESAHTILVRICFILHRGVKLEPDFVV